MDNPRGHRSSWAKIRPVESILGEACAELGEDFNTFTQRVCQAVHERPRRIAVLGRRVRDLWERLAEGRLLPQRKNRDDCTTQSTARPPSTARRR